MIFFKPLSWKLLSCLYFFLSLVLQDAMRKAEAAGNDDCPVKIKLVAPPLYVLTTQTLDKVCANPLLSVHVIIYI